MINNYISCINEGFDMSGMSDIDWTDTMADMDDRRSAIEEWCAKHIKFNAVTDWDKKKMTTYSGRYEIDESTDMINIRFDESCPDTHSAGYSSYVSSISSRYRNGKQVHIVDDVADPNQSNYWSGGDFPDYIQFNECDGDFFVENYNWHRCPPMTFQGFPVVVHGQLSVNLGLCPPDYFFDDLTIVNGWNSLPNNLDLSNLPTKTCWSISFETCGLTSLKGMPALISDNRNLSHESNICFGRNRLRNLDGINLSDNPRIYRFDISDNMIESLTGSPKYVYGNCDVSNNNLTSLVGMPKYIGGDFTCDNNFLKKSTVISRFSDVRGRKWGLSQQKKNPNQPSVQPVKRKSKVKIDEGFDFSNISDVDYTNTFSDMDDKMILIREWCDKHIKFSKVNNCDADWMITYSGHYVIDPSSYAISILFDKRMPTDDKYHNLAMVCDPTNRNGARVQIVDDVTDPNGIDSNNWTGGDFPDYIQFDKCEGDFLVMNCNWYACPPMTFRGFPITINRSLIVDIGLKNSNRFNDDQTVVDGWNNLPNNLDLSHLPTKTCNSILFTNCGLSSIKGMPALKPTAYVGAIINFSGNKLRNLDGINLSGNPKISVFNVSDNMIESLIGSPERINNNCNVSNNNLMSLADMPKYIGGDFTCDNNFLKKSTVISRFSDVRGRKCGLSQQKKSTVPARKKMNEGFDFSNMSDIDYTNTFADIDQKEEEKWIIRKAFASACEGGKIRIENGKMYRTIKQIINKNKLMYNEFTRIEKSEGIVYIYFSGEALMYMTTLSDNNELYIDPCILFGSNRSELEISNIGIDFTPEPDSNIMINGNISVSANADEFKVRATPNKNGNFIGMPYKIAGDVDIDNSEVNIRSFDGCPVEVTGDFWISFRERQSIGYPADFTGCPEIVGDYFCISTRYDNKDIKMNGSGLPLFAKEVDLCHITVPIICDNGKVQPLCQDGLNRKFNHLVLSSSCLRKIKRNVTDDELNEITRGINISNDNVEFRPKIEEYANQ